MDNSMYGLVAPVLFLILGVAVVLMARYLAGAVITGAIAYLLLHILLPSWSPKLHALKSLRKAVTAMWGSTAAFTELFVKDLHIVSVVALMVGAILAIVLIVRRGRWS